FHLLSLHDALPIYPTHFYIDNVYASTGEPDIVEENNYYPFGLKHKGYNNNIVSEHNWDYQGKENQKELGLDWHDFGARNYDAALGRWMNIDPLAEKGRRLSPYNYAFDNPINFIDPDGMWPWPSGGIAGFGLWLKNGIKTLFGAKKNVDGGDGEVTAV